MMAYDEEEGFYLTCRIPIGEGADKWVNLGPFEFTKLSSQIELLMARSRMASVDDPSHIKKYQPGGTFQSASRIVRARGFAGLYSGFHLHFSRLKSGNLGLNDEG